MTLTPLRPLRTVDVEREVALLVLGAIIVEDHAVGAELLGYRAVGALVVLVALEAIGEEAVRLGTLVGEVVPIQGCLGRRRLPLALRPSAP